MQQSSTSVRLNEFLNAYTVYFCRRLASSSTATVLRHELATCCLDITALPYTSTSCRCISPTDTSRAHKKRVTRCISKRDQFAKWVTTANTRSCAPAAHMPRITRTWIQPCAVCINDIRNLYAFGAPDTRPCKLFRRVHINSKKRAF